MSFFISGYGPGTASAADLGGDCCADLEERVAELEATTVRKGSRKLSMTISGRVNYGVVYFDDGGNTEADRRSDGFDIVHGLGGSSRISIDGRGQINSDLEALYRFRFKFDEYQDDDIRQNGRNNPSSDIIGDEIYVGLRSRTLGAITVGKRGEAHGGAGKTDISGKTGFAGNVDPHTYIDEIQFVRSDGTIVTGASIEDTFEADDGDDRATESNSVRYDSPSIAGFIVSASWSTTFGSADTDDQDLYAVRLTYANQFGNFKVAGSAAWFQEDNIETNPNQSEDSGWVASGGIMHVPTGLFVNAGGGVTDPDFGPGFDDHEFWYVTGGIQQKWTSLGATTVWGQYYSSDGNFADGVFDQDSIGADYWGVGINQTFDAVGMDLYAGYRKYSVDGATDAGQSIEDISVFIAGGVINF